MIIGVIIVCYMSVDVIIGCLQSLIDSRNVTLRIIVTNNASPDETAQIVCDWAKNQGIEFEEHMVGPELSPKLNTSTSVALLNTTSNLGFAGGVNIGLRTLLKDRTVDFFWILNPDCVVLPNTAQIFAAKLEALGPFSLMGGRILYHEAPRLIQSDGGRVNRWTGICSNVNQGLKSGDAPLPDIDSLDFISGANVVVSRIFVETAGLMPEHYFLYYEEVDWAKRRGSLPLVICPDAIVLHHGGTSIGTGSVNRRPSEFANYFNYRNLMRFMRRYEPNRLPIAFFYSFLKVVRLIFLQAWGEADGAFRGLCSMKPPLAVLNRLTPEAAKMAFSKDPMK